MQEKTSLLEGRSAAADDSASIKSKWIMWGWNCPRRHVVAGMAFLGFVNVYALRVILSTAIVAMTMPSPDGAPAEFNWDSKVQGVVLSSFFYGYIMTQLPAGYFSAKFGGRKILGIGVGVAGLLTILTPIFAKTNVYLLLIIRVAVGMFEGVAYPAMHAVWSRWAPPLERTKLSSFAFSGSYFGTVLAFAGSGVLARFFGWEWIFVLFGILAIIWSICWWYFVADAPAADKHITDSELEYIRETLGSAANKVKVNLDVPFRKILTSAPVWAIIISHFSENWGFYTLLTELPTFLNDIFGFQLEFGGALSSIPYLVMGAMVQIGGQLADCLRTRGYLTTGSTRKACNTIGFLMQASFLIIAAKSSSSVTVIIALSVGIGFGGLAWSGFGVNHLDIAPAYASVLMGISNTVATFPGMISPIVTGHLVTNKTREEWEAVFYIAAAIYVSGAAFYALFASGDEQPWARVDTALLRDDESATEDSSSEKDTK